MTGRGPVALIAGSGRLPVLLAARLAREGRGPLVCELEGAPSGIPRGASRLSFRVETLGSLLSELRARGIAAICLAGGVRRPVIDTARIDAATRPLLPRLMAALLAGDDGALRTILTLMEEAGFAILAAQDILPDLVPGPGVLSRRGPSPAQEADAARAAEVLRALSAADVGQACVVREGQVIAVECAPGTDWMLQSLAPPPGAPARGAGDPLTWAVDAGSDLVAGWADWLTGPEAPRTQAEAAPRARGDGGMPARGGLFFKAPKAGQDRRADLPAIGPATVRGCAAAGIAAIAVEAGGVMILDREETLAEADAAGLVLWARAP